MITFLTGKTGSGKSYKALYEIFNIINSNSNKNIFIKRKELRKKILSSNSFILKKYLLSQYPKYKKNTKKNIITNIAGFKYGDIRKYAKNLKSEVNFYKLNVVEFEDFTKLVHHYIEEHRKMPINEETEEDEGEMKYASNMIRKNHSEYNKYLDSIIIFDEAATSPIWSADQNKKIGSKIHILSWILIHRHLNSDIYIIVQDANLILQAYRSTVERFYVAQSTSYRIGNKMKYFVYSSLADIKNDFVKPDTIETLPINKKYFQYYKTGTNEAGYNPFKKYIYLIIFFFILIISLLYAFFYFFSSKTDNKINNKKQIINKEKNINNKEEDIKLSKNENDLFVKCSTYKEELYCKSNISDNEYIFNINLKSFKSILKAEDKDITFTSYENNIIFYIDKQFIKNYFYKITKDTTNEKNNNTPKPIF